MQPIGVLHVFPVTAFLTHTLLSWFSAARFDIRPCKTHPPIKTGVRVSGWRTPASSPNHELLCVTYQLGSLSSRCCHAGTQSRFCRGRPAESYCFSSSRGQTVETTGWVWRTRGKLEMPVRRWKIFYKLLNFTNTNISDTVQTKECRFFYNSITLLPLKHGALLCYWGH